jgi:predicted PurR-regulated permease PerM
MIWASLGLLDIPLAATWAIIGGVGNLIPFLGPIIASVPAVLLALLLGGWSLALIVVLIFILINQIDANVLSPIILAKAAALHPVTIVLGILVGALLFGLWGALLAVPLVSFFKLLYVDYYLGSTWYNEL